MRDVVYLVKRSERQEELRHSLRSLRNLPHGKVWLIGHKPEWATGVEHVETVQFDGRKHHNTARNMSAIREISESLSEEFYLFHDDFFIMDPVEQVPVFHRGPWDAWESRCVGTRRGAWGADKAACTSRLLQEVGKTPRWSYELHIPLPVNTALYLESLDALLSLHPEGMNIVQKRSWYGNFAGIGGERAIDVKFRNKDDELRRPFASSSDMAFSYMPQGRAIQRRFSQPCEYEQPPVSALERERARRRARGQ